MYKYAHFLGRHFRCQPLDPTLDIWSNFVKKKEKHFTSFFKANNLKIKKVALVAMLQGFPRVTKSYHRLPQDTAGYRSLPQVTTGSHPIFFIKKDTAF